MKHPIRILDTGLKPARWNVAMTAALAELHATGCAPDTVRFHRYPASVLLGHGQQADCVADLAYCRREGIHIARRVTGGGAVFMSPSMLAWDVAVSRSTCGGNLEAITRRIGQGLAAGLSQLGATARFRAPNDIEIAGRKVSGSSGYAGRRSVILQGTVLVTDEISNMAGALRLSESSLRSTVTCLADACGKAPPLPQIIACATCGLSDSLDAEPELRTPRAEEVAACETLLQQQVGSDAFVFGEPAGAAAWPASY
jgi:lipoate-protein ligase A